MKPETAARIADITDGPRPAPTELPGDPPRGGGSGENGDEPDRIAVVIGPSMYRLDARVERPEDRAFEFDPVETTERATFAPRSF